jgi:uncharacterized protein YhfF
MIGKKTNAVEAFWQRCRQEHRLEAAEYHACTFADPRFAAYHDMLIELVAEGKKRATAHLLFDFERNRIARRAVGDFWVVLSTRNEPRYLVRVTDVAVIPFNAVSADFAAREGEGDSSLRYWADVHRDYFTQQCREWGVPWREDYPTVCEGFELVASAQHDRPGQR